jgi:hypothetical protein
MQSATPYAIQNATEALRPGWGIAPTEQGARV